MKHVQMLLCCLCSVLSFSAFAMGGPCGRMVFSRMSAVMLMRQCSSASRSELAVPANRPVSLALQEKRQESRVRSRACVGCPKTNAGQHDGIQRRSFHENDIAKESLPSGGKRFKED